MIGIEAREADLVGVARALVTPGAYPSIEGVLARSAAVKTIGPTAMRLVEDTLAKGVVKALARFGGARPRARTGSIASSARVFEVRPPPRLRFGRYTFELLRWLTNRPLEPRVVPPPLEAKAETIGDELVAYLALDLVAGRRLEPALVAGEALRTPLAWLGFARSLARAVPGVPPSFAPLLAGEDERTVLECLGPELARRWTAASSWEGRGAIEAADAIRIGAGERRTLEGFLDAVDAAGRWDLATFVVDAAAALLATFAPPELARRAAPPVPPEGPLRARGEARRNAGAVFRALARVARKRDALALVRFIDDDYDVAQAILTAWDVLPRDRYARAEDVVSLLDSLDGLEPPTMTP